MQGPSQDKKTGGKEPASKRENHKKQNKVKDIVTNSAYMQTLTYTHDGYNIKYVWKKWERDQTEEINNFSYFSEKWGQRGKLQLPKLER